MKQHCFREYKMYIVNKILKQLFNYKTHGTIVYSSEGLTLLLSPSKESFMIAR